MEITDKCITHRNIKGLRNMSTISKTQDWESSYSKIRKLLHAFKMDELEFLQDAYTMMNPVLHELQIKAIKDELQLRKTSLGRELL